MGMSGVDGTGAAAARFLEPRRLQPGEELGSFSCSVELIEDWAAKLQRAGRVASAKCPCKNSRDSIGNAGRGFPLSEAGLGLDVAAGCCEEISCGEPANWFPCACRRSV